MYTLKDILLPVTFSSFLDSNNSSILWSLSFQLPKISASAFYCFQICKNLHGNLKYWPSYIFVVSSVYLTLHWNKCILLLNWTKLYIFVNKCPISLFYLHLKIYNKNSLWRESIRPSSSALGIWYFSQGDFTNWKHSIIIFSSYLKGIWKMFVKKQ